jgi:hypothetical protein
MLISIVPPPGWRSASISIESKVTGFSAVKLRLSPAALVTALNPDSQNSLTTAPDFWIAL